MAELQIIKFILNNDICGADTSQIKQIIKYQEPMKIPKMPKFIEGMLTLREKDIPVINLNTRFGLGETGVTKKTKILLSEIDGHCVGFIVNDVPELVKLSDGEVEALPDIIEDAGNRYIKRVGKKGGSIISIVDLHKILSEDELNKL